MSSTYSHLSIINYAALFFVVVASFFLASSVEAAFIIQRPVYVGLTQGLVGAWSFDGIDMQFPLDTISALGILTLLTPPRAYLRIGAGLYIMEQKERIFILIDGSNFYHRLRELKLQQLLNFDYKKFGRWLAMHRSIVAQSHYIGTIREEYNNPKSRILMANQQKLLGLLKKNDWNIQLGHMLKTDGYHEKGVDVRMAVDLLIGAYENSYDTAVLVSSDTDLIPALAQVRAMKKKVEYVGFSHKPSYALIANADIRRLLIPEEMAQFLP